jgi:serine/threonine protein kinase
MQEAEERWRAMASLTHADVRYRKYTIDEIEAATNNFSLSKKVGEGGYGPVYKCYLDHTPVAVKVLRPDASQGRSQFQQEVKQNLLFMKMTHLNRLICVIPLQQWDIVNYHVIHKLQNYRWRFYAVLGIQTWYSF